MSAIAGNMNVPQASVAALIAGVDLLLVCKKLDLALEVYEEIVRSVESVSYTHLRAHETVLDLVCRLLLEKKKKNKKKKI